MTRTIVALKISPEAYADIRARVIAAGYGAMIVKGPTGSSEAINLDGIAVTPEHLLNPRHIQLNGRYLEVTGAEMLTYERVVELAGQRGHPTVVWRVAGKSMRMLGGALLPGHSVLVQAGMIIDCVHTGNA